MLGPVLPKRYVKVTAFRRGQVVLTYRALPSIYFMGAPAAAVSGAQNVTWVHLCYVATFEGHPSGSAQFTHDRLTEMVKNFESVENQIPFKYEHPLPTGEPHPSAGWVHKLEVRKDSKGRESLFALTEFTDRAAKLIRNNEYRYCSVVVAFESQDRKSGTPIGAELIEVGLTDTPFVDDQEPIRFADMEAAA